MPEESKATPEKATDDIAADLELALLDLRDAVAASKYLSETEAREYLPGLLSIIYEKVDSVTEVASNLRAAIDRDEIMRALQAQLTKNTEQN